MPWKLTIRIGELLVTATLAIAIIAAWRAERADRAQLAAELAAAKQSLTQADDRQHTRDSQLLQTLATLAADKRSVTTPAQIIDLGLLVAVRRIRGAWRRAGGAGCCVVGG